MKNAAPCPFCRSTATEVVKLDLHEWVVVCDTCRASGPITAIPAQALERWCDITDSKKKPADAGL